MGEHDGHGSADTTDETQAALAIVESINGELAVLDRVEGVLLTAAGENETITPAALARRAGIDRPEAVDLFRQLKRTGAIQRVNTGNRAAQSAHAVDPDDIRMTLKTAREAARIIETQSIRKPSASTVEPLVTLPDDPAFSTVSPAQFGMRWLMPALTDTVSKADDHIVILNPFFEADGLLRLREAILDTLEDGTRVTIITRYLQDDTSHNHRVLSEFIGSARDAGVNTSQITLVDYTAWGSDVPDHERRQEGATPAFTLHAKLMLFDGERAYLGSANVTDYSFERYLELGTLLRGPVVRQYEEFVEALLDSNAATEVQV